MPELQGEWENTKLPLVSVIIPTYNRDEHIINAVRTVEQQTYPNIETVVVVDGSTDGTVDKLLSYRDSLPEEQQDRLKIVYQDNAGVSTARNTGFAHAEGDYIALLDDDDEWHPDKTALQVQELLRHPAGKPALCTTDHWENAPETEGLTSVSNINCMTLEGQLAEMRFSPTITWMFPRSTFEAIDGFDTRLHAGEDADFVLRMRKADIPFVNVNQPLATYNMPPADKTYRFSAESAAITMVEHDEWRHRNFPPDRYEAAMNWYEDKLGPELFAQKQAEIQKNRERRSELERDHE